MILLVHVDLARFRKDSTCATPCRCWRAKQGGGRAGPGVVVGRRTEGNTSSPHTRDRRSYDGWRRSCSPRLGEDQDGEGEEEERRSELRWIIRDAAPPLRAPRAEQASERGKKISERGGYEIRPPVRPSLFAKLISPFHRRQEQQRSFPLLAISQGHLLESSSILFLT